MENFKIKKSLIILSAVLFVFRLFSVDLVSAYKIESVKNPTTQGDYLLYPAKNDMRLEPGAVLKKKITVENNSGSALNFKIETEDFKGSKNPETPVILSGQEQWSYSSKQWLEPEISEFELKNGEKITMDVEISVPKDASPGGHYVVLVLSPQNVSEKNNQRSANSKIVSLFFIEVPGDFAESGFLKDFKIPDGRLFFERKPINFLLYFENNGLSHLTPSGSVEIKNIFGKQIEKFPIDPYFVLPDSSRLRKIVWSKPSLLGIFTATVSLNRGYKDVVDQKQIIFWILPRQIILFALGLLIAAILVLTLGRKKLETKKIETKQNIISNKRIIVRKRRKISLILLATVATFSLGFNVLAMESGNFKITEDSVDSMKTPGAVENYKIKDNKIDVGVANSGQIAGRIVPLQVLLPAIFVIGFLIVVFINKFGIRRKYNEY